jgi:chromosome segregation ATPase
MKMDQKDDLLAKIDEAIAASESYESSASQTTRPRRAHTRVRIPVPREEDLGDLTPTLEAIKDLQAKLDLSFNMQDAIQFDLNKTRLDLKTSQAKNKELEAELFKLQDICKEKEEAFQKTHDELSFLEEEKLIGDEKVQELQDLLRKKDQEMDDLHSEMKLMEMEKKNQIKENDDLRRHLASSESHIAELEKEVSKLQDSREKYQTQVKELEREVHSLRSTKEALLEIRKALSDTNAKVRERFYKNRESR